MSDFEYMTQNIYQKKLARKVILQNSLCLWLALTVINIFFISLSWHTNEKWLAVSLVSFLVQVFLTHQTLKQINLFDKGYWRRVFVGLFVSVVAGFGLIVSSLVVSKVIFPNYISDLRQVNQELLIESTRSKEDIDELLAVYDSPVSDWVLATAWLFKTITVGLIISLILAAIIKEDQSLV
ncbi:DUF4199 family protein [Candidatus Gracilibacteria bacterium]|nr:DUF4199 family protein [Candidatus Gracilibacteria bacterium]NJS41452.1 DUF4199 family protein [Candidatus Gracilibacteria bacterium]